MAINRPKIEYRENKNNIGKRHFLSKIKLDEPYICALNRPKIAK